MKLFEVLTYYRKLKKITFDELTISTGIPKSTLQKVFTGVTANPAFELVRTIAAGLDVSINDIAAATRENEIKPTFSPAALELARQFDRLDDHGQQVVSLIADLESKRMAATYAAETERFNSMANMAAPSTESSVG